MAGGVRDGASSIPSGNCLMMVPRPKWVGIAVALLLISLFSGCAEFLEDYQYNPAGPLYQDSGSSK